MIYSGSIKGLKELIIENSEILSQSFWRTKFEDWIWLNLMYREYILVNKDRGSHRWIKRCDDREMVEWSLQITVETDRSHKSRRETPES